SGRTPQFVGVIVTQIENFSGRVADRIVRPRRQLVFAAVPAPGATAAQLRYYKAELGIGDHIDPGSRCPLAVVEHNHIFASILGKAAQSVEKLERRDSQRRRMSSG